MRIVNRLLVLILLFLSLLAPTAHAETKLVPDTAVWNLVIGTAGSSLSVSYSGSIGTPPDGAEYCKVLDVYLVNDYGLRPVVKTSNCVLGSRRAWVTLTFEGAYNGKTGEYRPISNVVIGFYDSNGSLIETRYLDADPITINAIEMTVTVTSVDTSSLDYVVRPDPPTLGAAIQIFTVGTVTLSIQLSAPPDVATDIMLEVSQPTGYEYNMIIHIPEGEVSVSTEFLADVSSAVVSYTLKSADGSVIIAQGEAEIPETGNADYTALILQPPYEVGPGAGGVIVQAPVFISTISSGTLTVTVTIAEASGTITVSDAGVYNIEVIVPEGTDILNGQYMVTYTGRHGSVSFTVSFSTESSRGITTGNVVKIVFQSAFMVILAASSIAVVLGFLLKRPDVTSGGLMGMSSAVLVFMIPTIMAYVVRLLLQSGLHPPEGIDYNNINMYNIGEVVGDAVDWTSQKATAYASNLRNTAIIILGVIGLLTGAVSVGGFVGIITGGALSQFLGRVLGEFGAQLIIIALYSFFASYFLDVLAYVYPIVINTILIVMFFAILLYALFAAYTGNIGQVYQPIIQFSLLVLTLLLVPMMLQTVDYIQDNVGSIPMPEPISRVVERIPNPFFWLAAAVFKIILLVTVMYMAFNRLIAILSGGGG